MTEKSSATEQIVNKILQLLQKRRHHFVPLVLILFLFFTRFVNLGWGLPYPFHPDERNMADALTQLHCSGWNRECFNPHFFAYGQLPLYLGYLGIYFLHFLFSRPGPTTFIEAVISLRIISAAASVGIWMVLLKSMQVILEKEKSPFLKKKMGSFDLKTWVLYASGLVFIFSPAFIQFSHFGTTESLLMLFYSILIYLSLLILQGRIKVIQFAVWSGLVCGLALATKSSAVSYLTLPVITILYNVLSTQKLSIVKKIALSFIALILLGLVSGVGAILFSPFNFIALNDFLGSMQYESAIGLGRILVFYTKQFQMTLPVVFQFTSIFPFALGVPVLVLFSVGFFLLPNKREFNILRLAFLLYFIPSAFIFAKWTRFVAPVFPVMLLIGAVFLTKSIELLQKKLRQEVLSVGLIFLGILLILRGVSYLSIYTNPDIRFTASEWIYNNIPANSVILSETANVVDLPIIPPEKMNKSLNIPNYRVISFNFYDLDTDFELQTELRNAVAQADYIIIPSRRVFANHTCFKKTITDSLLGDLRCNYFQSKYPALNAYYADLFTGKLGFVFLKEFDPSPSISLGKFKIEFPDETAEETWTVFDHPTIRIYKKMTTNATQ